MHSNLLMTAGMLLLDRLYIVPHSILCVCRCLALHASSAAAIFSAFMTPSRRHCQSVLLLTPPYLAQANITHRCSCTRAACLTLFEYIPMQACLAWWNVVSPFGGFGSTAALAFVLIVAAVKAIFEDKKRHQEDHRTNKSTAHVVHADGQNPTYPGSRNLWLQCLLQTVQT